MNIKRKIVREIVAVSRCISFIRNFEFKKYDLTRGQHSFLTRIMENPGLSQEEISFMLRVDKTTSAKAIKKLESKGYILRKRSDKDKRQLCLYPTDKLKEIYPDLLEKINLTTKIGTEGFTDEELQTLYSLLSRLRKNVDKEWLDVKKKL
jgi:DNA-binding MarR family transcriptional regulator